MMSILVETVVVAFVVGGILGAITALHLSNPKKVPVRIDDKNRSN